MSECTFCAELTGEETNNLLRIVLREGCTTRVVRETENFVVLPTIGQIVEGYLLIVSKQHYLSFGHIPAQCFREFMNLKEETRQVLSEVYTSPIFFEHGPISESKRGGCCVEHAHLHVVPARIDLLDKLKLTSTGVLLVACLLLDSKSSEVCRISFMKAVTGGCMYLMLPLCRHNILDS